MWQQDRWQPRIRPSCQSCDFGCITLGRNAVWRVTHASQHGTMVDPRMNVLIEQGVLGELFSVGEATGHCGILHGTFFCQEISVCLKMGCYGNRNFGGFPYVAANLMCVKMFRDVARCSQVHRSVLFPMLTPWHPLRVQDAVSIGDTRKQHQIATFLGILNDDQ